MGDTSKDMPPVEDNGPERKSIPTDQSSIPVRLRNACVARYPNAMPPDFSIALAQFIEQRRDLFTVGGHGHGRYNYEVLNLSQWFDLSSFHALLGDAASESLGTVCVEPFDFDRFDVHLTMYHHNAFFDWHDDTPGVDGEHVNTRRVTFSYYFNPVRDADGGPMFQGGELEFMDGTRIAPEHNLLVLFNPLQRHRINSVECFHADPAHGRFALTGWLHSRQTLRHFAWTNTAKRQGACDIFAEGGDVTGWPQDVTCLDCAQDLQAVLADAGAGFPVAST